MQRIRDVYYEGEKIFFSEVSRKVELSNKFTGRTRNEQILAGAVRVSVPVDPHPR